MSKENMNNPEEEARSIDQEDKEQILQSYDKFINYLGKQVSRGEKMGMDEEPRNREEQVLKELWKATENDDEKKTVARALVRTAQKTNS